MSRERPDGGAGRAAVHLPMDGFHLANATLDRLGLRDRKGAIETFDGWGFLALLERVRRELDHVVYAPAFERRVDEPVAGEIAIGASARFVVVEGNYPWPTRSRGGECAAWSTRRGSARPTTSSGHRGSCVGTPRTAARPRPREHGRPRSTARMPGHPTVTGPGGPRRVGRDVAGHRRPRGVTGHRQPAVRTLPYWSTVMIAVSFLRFSAR